jgi:hypothetical protein
MEDQIKTYYYGPGTSAATFALFGITGRDKSGGDFTRRGSAFWQEMQVSIFLRSCKEFVKGEARL